MSKKKGLLITLEGIDGCGKSTVARLLATELDSAPWHLVFTAEPTGGEIGRVIRTGLRNDEEVTSDQAMKELFLFMADHADHLRRKIRPELERGSIVISDRYCDSRAAYQGATLKGLVPRPVLWVRELHRPWSVTPDLTLLLRVDPTRAVERCRSRNHLVGEEEKFERADFLKEVSENFDQLVGVEPDRFVVIDANAPLEIVARQALDVMMNFILQQS